MDEPKDEMPAPVGLVRFHKLTIGCGVIFLGLMIWRYWRQYRLTESPRYIVYGSVAAALMIGLALYLRSFSRKSL